MPPRVTETGTLTTIALVGIAIFAALVVIGILWGAHLRRQRNVAERIEDGIADREQQIEAHQATVKEPLPVAPPPPPLAPEPPMIEERVATEQPSRLADEPIAASAPLEAAPAMEAASAPEGPSPADGPIGQIKGLGPKLAQRLAEQGITTVGQLAALTPGEAEALDARLGPFTGRMNRDRWIEQARFLAAGDRAGFEAVFGKL